MFVFIDEAGGFQPVLGKHQLSVVAAVLVPESLARGLFRRFRKQARALRAGRTELKGSSLDETQIAAIVRAIRRYDVMFVAVGIDMGLHTNEGVEAHKHAQVEIFRNTMGPDLQGWQNNQLKRLAAGTEKLSNQLYVQSVLMTAVIQQVLQLGTLYYVQRIPKTLSRFVWRVDGKDRFLTPYEELWQEVVLPHLEWRSLEEPMFELDDADYTAMAPFQRTLPEPPKRLADHVAQQVGPFHCLDVAAVLNDVRFCGSHQLTGLQIVDVLAAATRRACNGSLEQAGWSGLGRLMVNPKRDHESVRMIALQPLGRRTVPYAGILKHWEQDARQTVLLPGRRRRARRGVRHR